MDKVKVMSIFGTRPEATKMAPLIKAMDKCDDIEQVVCVTAQHRQMLDQVLEILGIKFKFEQSLDSEIEAMIEARQLAREVRDFAKSDEIRDALKAQGIVLEDTKDGVRWHRE